MKWKVEVLGKGPSAISVRRLARRTGVSPADAAAALERDGRFVCRNLEEGEAQDLADSLRGDSGLSCRVLPDTEESGASAPLFRVLLVNYRPGCRTRLRRRLQEMTRLPQDEVILWLSRLPCALGRGLDGDTARRVGRHMTEAGGIVRVEPEVPDGPGPASRRRSNAVFRSGGEPSKTDGEIGRLFSAEPEERAGPVGDPGPPPLRLLPEGLSVGPPPLEEIETSDGTVMMHPPAKITPGQPRVTSDGRFEYLPPVLPRVSRGRPGVLESSPPPVSVALEPPVVGSREHSKWADEPAPEVVIFFPPPGGGEAGGLPPPVIPHRRMEPAGSGPDLFDTGPALEETPGSASDGSVSLLLCRPAPENEDIVADALRRVLDVSLRESWDFLRKAPCPLRRFSDPGAAVRMAHRLESMGVPVSITGPHAATRCEGGKRTEDLRTWLQKNG